MSATRSAFQCATALAAVALLTACNVKTHDKNGNETAAISFGGDADGNGAGDMSGDGSKTVSVDVPGFSAKVAVPDLDIGGKDTDIDGIKLYPGTKMNGVNVLANAGDGSGGESQGKVVMAFSAPIPPDQLLGYYKGEAAKAGWKEEPAPGGSQFAATKIDEKGKSTHLTLNLAGAGTGSTGKFQILGE
jgi:hypothetical protein